MLTLRPYQQLAIDMTFEYMSNNDGNPCIVLPTGSGKSIVIAELCRYIIQTWPGMKILKLTNAMELIEQNAEKLRAHWPNAPVGIYSAGLKQRDLGEPITFAGIQSIRKRSQDIGFVDVIIVDECHAIGHNKTGGYRSLIDDLTLINPNLRVIGLTATPYRLGHGLITDKPAIFDDLIEPTSIIELQKLGFLADLRSKSTEHVLDVSQVAKRGGDYVESDLQEAVDTELMNEQVVQEVIKRAGDRKAWLFFCSGVEHAKHICDILLSNGINAATVTGATPKAERAQIIAEYRAGKITALTNCDVLTTGFDYPGIDLIAMVRPTMSAGLYMQMAGRGLRLKPHTDHCLVLDFAGVVKTHGPIVAVKTPEKKKGKGNQDGVECSKMCPACGEILAISAKICTNPDCNHVFEIEKPVYQLHDDDIMGRNESKATVMVVDFWVWKVETSSRSGMDMITVTYHGTKLSDRPVKEYFCVYHGGYTAQKAIDSMSKIARLSGARELTADAMTKSSPPLEIHYIMDGKFAKVTQRIFDEVPF